MKRIRQLGFPILVLALFLKGAGAAPVAGQQPVYVYLQARISDHVNMDLTEDRLRHILPMVEKYRKAYPNAGVSATILFSGAVSQALAERNSQTHVLDFVQDFVKRGVIEAGYDGTAEPTFKKRPLVELRETKTAEDRWLMRVATAEKFLTEARDPLTGAPQPGKSGGLKRMQEVFGEAACIAGVTLFGFDAFTVVIPEYGADSETLHQLRHYNTRAIMIGVPEANPSHIPRYKEWAGRFSKELSPAPETPPGLYWQENVLRASEMSGPENHLILASEGPVALDGVIAKLDRSKTCILHVELGSDKNYLTPAFARGYQYPPLKFSYENPNNPKLPQAARRPAAEVDAAYVNEDGVFHWLTEKFLPANSGSRFVSSADLKQVAGPAVDYNVSVRSLRSAVEEMVKAWGDGPIPPKYLRVGGQYLSMADMFQVMTDALAGLNRTGKLPQSVRLVPVFGPIDTPIERGPSGQVTAASIARVCANMADRFHNVTWTPIPKNAVPTRVTIDGIDVNPAQFLRLMAEALVAPSPEAKLKVKPTDMFWGREEVYYKTRSMRDEGGAWTFKPAPLQLESTLTARQ